MPIIPNIPDNLEKTGPDDYRRYHGRYLGYVRDNLDPERRGRVRVYCPEVMGEVDEPNRWLGFAEAVAPGSGFDQGLFTVPTMPSDTPRDEGDSTSPFNQTRVWMSFRDGNPAKPIYDQGGPWIGGELILNHTPVLTAVDNGGDESIALPNGTGSSTKVEANYETGVLSEGTKVDEPVPSTGATYPRNTVWKSSGGSIVEFDDTPGAERIKIFHPSGSYFEINQSGTLVQRTTGKKVEFVSDESFCSIRGPSTQVFQSTQHLQVDRSSQNIYRDSRLVVTTKAEKRFNRGPLDHDISGLLNFTTGGFKLESTGNVDLFAGSSANLGGNQVNLMGLDTKVVGYKTCEVTCPTGVHLTGLEKTTKHRIYASNDIDTVLSSTIGVLNTATAALTTALGGLGSGPAPANAVLTWSVAATAMLNSIQLALSVNKTIHKASRF